MSALPTPTLTTAEKLAQSHEAVVQIATSLRWMLDSDEVGPQLAAMLSRATLTAGEARQLHASLVPPRWVVKRVLERNNHVVRPYMISPDADIFSKASPIYRDVINESMNTPWSQGVWLENEDKVHPRINIFFYVPTTELLRWIYIQSGKYATHPPSSVPGADTIDTDTWRHQRELDEVADSKTIVAAIQHSAGHPHSGLATEQAHAKFRDALFGAELTARAVRAIYWGDVPPRHVVECRHSGHQVVKLGPNSQHLEPGDSVWCDLLEGWPDNCRHDSETASEEFTLLAPTPELVDLAEAILNQVLRKATPKEMREEVDHRQRCSDDDATTEPDSLTEPPKCLECNASMRLYAAAHFQEGRVGTVVCGACAYAAQRRRGRKAGQPKIADAFSVGESSS